MTRPILILGAGVCGLACAMRLAERMPEAAITLLECGDRPGGLARSLTVDGMVTDLGPHRIYTELPDVREFLRDLAGPDLVEVRRVSRMWFRGGWIEYPPKPLEILRRLGPLTMTGATASFAAGKAAAVLGRKSASGENFETIMVEAFGRQLFDLFVGPYAEKVWKVRASEIHADIGRVRVSAGGLDRMIRRLVNPDGGGPVTALKTFHYIEGGVESLVRKMTARLAGRNITVATDIRAEGISREPDGGYRVSARRGDGSTADFRAAEVVSTIPLPQLLEMLASVRQDEGIQRRAGELRYIANFLVGATVAKPSVSDAHWLYFPTPDTIFNRGYLPKNFHGGMAPADKCLLVLEITCHEGDAIWRTPDAALAEQAVADLDRIGLVRRGEVSSTFVHRIPNTYPLYDRDYALRMDEIVAFLGHFPGLVSTGRQGLFLHNNMDHSMHMGFGVADLIASGGVGGWDPRAFYARLREFQQFRIVD